MYLWTGIAIYEEAARFWTKIFAVNFAIGVVTGIVMEFEFGTNWAMYSRFRRRRVWLGTGGGRDFRVLSRIGLSRRAGVRLGPREPEDSISSRR